MLNFLNSKHSQKQEGLYIIKDKKHEGDEQMSIEPQKTSCDLKIWHNKTIGL